MWWTITVVMIIIWVLALTSGYTIASASFIHILLIAAVALLVVGLSQEIMINRNLRHVWRSLGQKTDS